MAKRIISFSLWGDNTMYTEGAIRNAEVLSSVYPGWIARFHHDDSVSNDVLEKLGSFADVELRRMEQTTGALAMFWRFHPMFEDVDVERFIVRDTDSTIGEREATAVVEWVKSGRLFHIVRDCESHNIPILGGTWGSVRGCVPFFEERMHAFIGNVQPDKDNPRGEFHGQDQIFLGEVVWPHIRHNHLAHIQAGCEGLRYTPEDVELPPWKDGERYVGMVG